MIRGKATSEGTSDYLSCHPLIQGNPLGRTHFNVSPAGFGCYRVNAGIESHTLALSRALLSGVNLIDTSTNYTDGGSETLVGQVLEQLIRQERLARNQVVVVSKVGYLQGQNYELSQRRKQSGKPFPDLVPYGSQLEHCIHPEFIADQLERSLKRLQLETLDVLLLHNPEYYLSWAYGQGADLDSARIEFYNRIADAFNYLEQQVRDGRIQSYGISANTFVADSNEVDFVSLQRVWETACRMDPDHHFQVVQFPMNLFESGAIMRQNQSNENSVLSFAHDCDLGVLINRPLNAFFRRRLTRLADPEPIGEHSDDDVIQAINALNKSEKALWRKRLIELSLPQPLYQRIKDQAAVADQLKHYWRNFGSHDRWCQVRDGFLNPRIQGVFDYLEGLDGAPDAISNWLDDHKKILKRAFRAVGSLYIADARKQVRQIKNGVAQTDPDWAEADRLSQQAVRALRSTSGISSVLVGMRRVSYVDDVLQELQRPIKSIDRTASWQRLGDMLKS